MWKLTNQTDIIDLQRKKNNMTSIIVNSENAEATHDMQFDFPPDWQVEQYDAQNSFYRRRRFEGIAESKAVDIVAINPSRRELWLIEVKDFRAFPKKDTQDMIGIVIQKVRDTLAGILTAAFYENGFYRTAVNQEQVRVVFHLEQPEKHSKLYPQLIDLANGTIKLRQRIRVIDPHPILCNMESNCNPWTVTETRRTR